MVEACSDRTEASRDDFPHSTLDHVAPDCGESMEGRAGHLSSRRRGWRRVRHPAEDRGDFRRWHAPAVAGWCVCVWEGGSKRTRYQESKANHRLVTLIVPAVSAEEDPMSTSTRTIELYVVHRRQLWLDLDDLEWTLRFMYMQIALNRVPVPEVPELSLCTLATPQNRKLNSPW